MPAAIPKGLPGLLKISAVCELRHLATAEEIADTIEVQSCARELPTSFTVQSTRILRSSILR